MDAGRVLQLAQDSLRLLRAVQREQRRARGLRGRGPRIPWEVEISGSEIRFGVAGDPEPWREC